MSVKTHSVLTTIGNGHRADLEKWMAIWPMHSQWTCRTGEDSVIGECCSRVLRQWRKQEKTITHRSYFCRDSYQLPWPPLEIFMFLWDLELKPRPSQASVSRASWQLWLRLGEMSDWLPCQYLGNKGGIELCEPSLAKKGRSWYFYQETEALSTTTPLCDLSAPIRPKWGC